MPLPPRLLRWIGFLAAFLLLVMTVLRAAVYVGAASGQLDSSQLGAAFLLGLRFDARVVAALGLVLLFIGSVPRCSPWSGSFARMAWLRGLAAFVGLFGILYVSDFLHFRYLHQRLNATALGLLNDASIAATMLWQTYPVVWISMGIILASAAALLGLGRLHRRLAARAEPSHRGWRRAWYAASIGVAALTVFGRIGQYPLRWSDAFNLRNDLSAHLALNPVESLVSSLSFRGSGYDRAKVGEHYAHMAAYLGVPAPDSGRLVFERTVEPPAAGPVRPPNVILVLCESFSAYKSSMWGNPLDPTPFFAGLAAQGLFFDNCYTPHIGTARGVWATLTGIPDVEPRKTASRNPALVDQHTILNDFEDHEKFYFLGGSSSWANIRGLLTNNIAGLHLYEEDSYRSPRIDVWGISDKNLLLEANDVLARQTKPFFAIIQTADNHRPYTIPREDLAEFTRVEVPPADLKAAGFESLAELNAFRYTDFAFRKFIEAARQAPYFDDTIFVFIGDHGIGGHAGSRFPAAWTDLGLTCYHVPLLFYAPQRIAPRRLHAVASMVDVLPTTAGLAGIRYRNTTLGRDLVRQDALDGGRSNVAFVIDHNSQSIGMIAGSYFGSHQRGGSRHDFAWADFAAPAPDAMPAAQADYRRQAEAFYETARFLLLHNKKPDTAKGAD